MKSIKQIVGDIQQVFDFDFDFRLFFDDTPTEDHLFILNIFRTINEDRLIIENKAKTGRPLKSRQAIFRSFLAKSILQIPTNTQLLLRLKADVNLRKLCGYYCIKDLPSESVLSRAFSEFSESETCQKIHKLMIDQYLGDILIGHISRDSTAIHSREKPMNRKEDAVDIKPKRKRGRPKKGEIVEPKEPSMIEKQLGMTPKESLEKLNLEAAWGCKVNSQGKKNHWKGYKLHLDVTDFGLPVTAVLTGANVYDNQLAIPMEKMTEKRIKWCYSLMDSAYDAKTIDQFIRSRNRIPIIDNNKRRGEKIHFAPAQKERYKIRSSVERGNAHLKDWLFGTVYVKGYKKVFCHLMFGVIVLAAVKIIQYIYKFNVADSAA